MTNTQLPLPINYIADEWSECLLVPDAWNLDPNTGQPIHRAVTTGPDDVERALRHAERSYSVDHWVDAAKEERAAVIERAAAIIQTRIEDIAGRVDDEPRPGRLYCDEVNHDRAEQCQECGWLLHLCVFA